MKSVDQQIIRILHVVGGMNRGGIETWLMHILRNIDRDRFRMDFLVHTTEPCSYDEEVRTLGSRIISCPSTSNPWIYGSELKKILQQYGPYNIVHSHVHHFSGYVLRVARQASVPIRIAHSHNDTSTLEAKATWTRKFYLNLTKSWITRYATIGLAASRRSAQSLFGSHWENDPRWRVLYYGIDLTPFRQSVDQEAIRNQLDIPADAFVIGHVGRFEEQKNHEFILDIAGLLAKKDAEIRLLLVGDGSLRGQMEKKVHQMNLSDHVIFVDNRSDVPQLMLGAMDVFLFPSLYEGLGLVLIEAQAAGLPCYLSDVVPEEADVIEPLMKRISLSQPASVWAEAIFANVRSRKLAIAQDDALPGITSSPFNIEICVKKLAELYESQESN